MAGLMYFLLFAAGLFLLVKGSEWFVDSAVWAAQVFRIPPLIIGATVVSICTTLPETFVSAAAALKNEPVMAAGNAFGSIAVNTGFILAVLFFTMRPAIENRRELIRNCFFLSVLLILLWLIIFFNRTIDRWFAAGFFLLFVLHIVHNVQAAANLMDLDIRYDIVDEEVVRSHEDPHNPMPEGMAYDEAQNDFNVSIQLMIQKIIFFILGVSLVLFGSNLIVDNGIYIAALLGVPNYLIAAIFTAVGTSLPELTAVAASVRKGVSSLGIGNIVGANILNILQVIGISALLHPLAVSAEKSILLFQLPMLTVMALSITGLAAFSGKRLSQWGGIWLFFLYFIFLCFNLFREAIPGFGPILF